MYRTKTGSFLASRPTLMTSQQEEGEGAFPYAYVNNCKCCNSEWRGASKHTPLFERPRQNGQNSCMHEKPGMRKQRHIKTYRNPQPGNDQSKARNRVRERVTRGEKSQAVWWKRYTTYGADNGKWKSWQQEEDKNVDWPVKGNKKLYSPRIAN
jgi:hypothetical protein